MGIFLSKEEQERYDRWDRERLCENTAKEFMKTTKENIKCDREKLSAVMEIEEVLTLSRATLKRYPEFNEHNGKMMRFLIIDKAYDPAFRKENYDFELYEKKEKVCVPFNLIFGEGIELKKELGDFFIGTGKYKYRSATSEVMQRFRSKEWDDLKQLADDRQQHEYVKCIGDTIARITTTEEPVTECETYELLRMRFYYQCNCPHIFGLMYERQNQYKPIQWPLKHQKKLIMEVEYTEKHGLKLTSLQLALNSSIILSKVCDYYKANGYMTGKHAHFADMVDRATMLVESKCQKLITKWKENIRKKEEEIIKNSFNIPSVEIEYKDLPNCVVCMQKTTTHIILPCAHVCLCSSCAEESQRQHVTKCPMCNTNIEKITKTYYG